ncbi:5011_t:CDS:2 [Paraglomus occultum]|uniref:5011_t:CDS:1 n=1 Tax=Paraglomus occultum TaxID=144539 RepID=A0A9N8ZSS1_9GLOM|nr:5011_t:CDS:2 [Paraglomus occultum]
MLKFTSKSHLHRPDLLIIRQLPIRYIFHRSLSNVVKANNTQKSDPPPKKKPKEKITAQRLFKDAPKNQQILAKSIDKAVPKIITPDAQKSNSAKKKISIEKTKPAGLIVKTNQQQKPIPAKTKNAPIPPTIHSKGIQKSKLEVKKADVKPAVKRQINESGSKTNSTAQDAVPGVPGAPGAQKPKPKKKKVDEKTTVKWLINAPENNQPSPPSNLAQETLKLTVIDVPEIESGPAEFEFASSESQTDVVPLKVGDLVEFRRNGNSFIGILYKLRGAEGIDKTYTLLPSGAAVPHRDDDIAFHIPGFAYLPRGDKPAPPEGSPIFISHARLAGDLEKAAISLMQYKHLEFKKAYSHFIQTSGTTPISTKTMASHVFKENEPQSAQLLAAHLFMMKHYIHFIVADPSKHRSAGYFKLRPLKSVNDLEAAMQWTRKTTHPTMNTSIENLPKFTDDDRLFIDMLKQYTLEEKGWQDLSLDVSASAILKPLKLYKGIIDKDCVVTFLRDIGVWTPWENLAVYHPVLKLQGHGVSKDADAEHEQSIQLARKLLDLPSFDYSEKKKTLPKENNSKTGPLIKTRPVLGEEEFYPYDICSDIRHDFGNLPVYTIDDPTAHEIDDGVSIERVMDNGSGSASTWVHVHVADPSAYIHPAHKLARLAKSRVQTVYFPEKNYGMLPESLNEKRFSLGTETKDGGNNVMTFSVQIDDNGNIMNYKVQPGIVRQVKTLYYDDVDSVLSWDCIPGGKEEAKLIHSMCHYYPNPVAWRKLEGSVPAWAHKDLLDLQQVAKLHMQYRFKNGSFNYNEPFAEVAIAPRPLPSNPSIIEQPTFYSGNPDIQVTVDRSNHSPARAMVAELMIMAGRAAALFCHERNIPMTYRTQVGSQSTIYESILSHVDPVTGVLPVKEIAKIRPFMGSVQITTEAGPHLNMGIKDGYCKVTSPLRRYVDMLAHWQIKAHLLGETPPFSTQDLNNLASSIRSRERTIKTVSSRATKYWVLFLVRRLLEQGKSLECTAVVTDDIEKDTKIVYVREFGVNAKLIEGDKLTIGDVAKVRPIYVQPHQWSWVVLPIK